MNTLSKHVTTGFFTAPEHYELLKKSWSERMIKREELPAEVHLLYLILRGKDWRKGFLPGNAKERSELYNCGAYKAVDKLASELTSKWANKRILQYFPELVENSAFSEDVCLKVYNLLPSANDVYKAIESGQELPSYKQTTQV